MFGECFSAKGFSFGGKEKCLYKERKTLYVRKSVLITKQIAFERLASKDL